VLREVRMRNFTRRLRNSPKSVDNRWVRLRCYRRTDDDYGRSDGLRRNRLDWHGVLVRDAELWELLCRSDGGCWDCSILLRLLVASSASLTCQFGGLHSLCECDMCEGLGHPKEEEKWKREKHVEEVWAAASTVQNETRWHKQGGITAL
jgi:hypothetical protein